MTDFIDIKNNFFSNRASSDKTSQGNNPFGLRKSRLIRSPQRDCCTFSGKVPDDPLKVIAKDVRNFVKGFSDELNGLFAKTEKELELERRQAFLEKAENSFKEIKDKFSEESRQMIKPLQNLANAKKGVGDFAGAEVTLKEALRIAKQTTPDNKGVISNLEKQIRKNPIRQVQCEQRAKFDDAFEDFNHSNQVYNTKQSLFYRAFLTNNDKGFRNEVTEVTDRMSNSLKKMQEIDPNNKALAKAHLNMADALVNGYYDPEVDVVSKSLKKTLPEKLNGSYYHLNKAKSLGADEKEVDRLRNRVAKLKKDTGIIKKDKKAS